MKDNNPFAGPSPFFTATLAGLCLGAVVFLSLFSSCAQAGDLNVGWVNATTDIDGVVLPPPPDPDSLNVTRVQWGLCTTASGSIMGTVTTSRDVAAQTVLSTVVVGVADGNWCVRALHITLAGVMSDWSVTVSKVVRTPKKPRPPGNPHVV